jgi:hypothetical protein
MLINFARPVPFHQFTDPTTGGEAKQRHNLFSLAAT